MVHEIAGLGELRGEWHDLQMSWLESHLSIINRYSQALENLDTRKGLAHLAPHLIGPCVCTIYISNLCAIAIITDGFGTKDDDQSLI